MPNYNQTLQTNNSSLEEIITQLNNLPEAGGGEPTLQDKTVTPTTSKQTITADSGYDGLDTVTVNAVPTATQATPSVSINQSTGLITATATQTAGYVTAGSKSGTLQLAFQPAQTITPGTTNKTIAANTYLGGVQTIKGDANLVASNIVSGKSIFGVVGTATAGGGGSSGDTSMEDGLVTRTLTTYTNDRATTVGDYAFYNCSKLTTVNFPVCTTIGSSAFYSCRSLTSVSFPSCTSIEASAFYKCSSLTTVNFPVCKSIGISAFTVCKNLRIANFPVCTSIGESAFYSCSNLSSVNFPNCTSIGNSAFGYCSSLTTVSFPACTSIGNSAFGCCSRLTTVSFPVCTNIGEAAFAFCYRLTSANFPVCTSIGSLAFGFCSILRSVNFPNCTSIGDNAFGYCSSLTSASFPVCTNIGDTAFSGCYRLSKLYLTGSSVCKLSASNAFKSTPFAGYSNYFSGAPYIYVPASLVNAYKSATNWTYFSKYISAYGGGGN